MSTHRSLKRHGGRIGGKRNVLSRLERLKILQVKGEWDPETSSATGLRKVRPEQIRLIK